MVYGTIYGQHCPERNRSFGKKVRLGCLEIIFLSQIFGILELIIILSFNLTICLIFICGIFFLLIVFHMPLCNVRQPYTGCPFTCNLAEITRNETVWRMRTNNVKGVYSGKQSTQVLIIMTLKEKLSISLCFYSVFKNKKCHKHVTNAPKGIGLA